MQREKRWQQEKNARNAKTVKLRNTTSSNVKNNQSFRRAVASHFLNRADSLVPDGFILHFSSVAMVL
jgi:hypothetical protein